MAIELDPNFAPAIDNLTNEFVKLFDRTPKPSSVRQIQKIISCVAANLVRAYIQNERLFVGISLGPQYYTKSRYNCQGVGFDNLRRIIEFMRNRRPALISYHVGGYRQIPNRRSPAAAKKIVGRATRIRLTAAFLDMINHDRSQGKPDLDLKGLSPFSIVPVLRFETIWLKDKSKNLIAYDDNDETYELRKRLDQWNEFVGLQWIDLYVPDRQLARLYDNLSEGEIEELNAHSESEQPEPRYVDLMRRRVYRVFNNSTFSDGGRFYGGWWQSIPSRWRPHITINWYPTHELDYSSMQPAMLYAKVGLSLDFDAYDIEGFPKLIARWSRRLLCKSSTQLGE